MDIFGEGLDVDFNSEGWGPSLGVKIDTFGDVPYAHFDKKDKCWKHAAISQDDKSNQKLHNRYKSRGDDMGNAEFSFKHDSAEDSSFKLVDPTKTQTKGKYNKRPYGHGGRMGGAGGRGGGRTSAQAAGRAGRGKQQQQQRGGAGRGAGKGRGGWQRREKTNRNASVPVRGDWNCIEEIDFSELSKLQTNQPSVQDLCWCGQLDRYDETLDKVTSKAPRPLRRMQNKLFYCVTTTDDPIIEKFAVEGVGNVFATDAIISQLMVCARSIYSWDLVIQKVNDMIFIDKRDDSQFDLLTVSETAQIPPDDLDNVEEINRPEKLSVEATAINQNFSQQALKNETELRKSYEPNPFFEEDPSAPDAEPASVAYRYRKFTLGNINLVLRCELHGWTSKYSEELLMTCHALNEWDSDYCGGVKWRQTMEKQLGAVLITEIRNNGYKLGKWAAESLLAGADIMKLGYVSRDSNTNAFDHSILATQTLKPKDLASQITMSLSNMWGVIKMICDLVMSKEDGKFVLLKDPVKPIMRLYSVPMNTFESDEEDDDEDDEDDDEDAEEYM